jgi:hypothetical protein
MIIHLETIDVIKKLSILYNYFYPYFMIRGEKNFIFLSEFYNQKKTQVNHMYAFLLKIHDFFFFVN